MPWGVKRIMDMESRRFVVRDRMGVSTYYILLSSGGWYIYLLKTGSENPEEIEKNIQERMDIWSLVSFLNQAEAALVREL